MGSLDQTDKVIQLISSIIDICAVATGVVIGFDVLAGLVAVATGGAALAAAADVFAVVAGIFILAGIFEGSVAEEIQWTE